MALCFRCDRVVYTTSNKYGPFCPFCDIWLEGWEEGPLRKARPDRPSKTEEK